MVETPALIPSLPVYKGMATAALILGIVGIFIPFVGVALGIVAIIFGIIALRKKTSTPVPAVIGIAAGGFAILITALAIAIIGYFSGHSPLFPPSDRDKAVTAMVNSKKDFGVGETAIIGSKNVKITSVERNHVLTADEKQSEYNNPVEVSLDQPHSNYLKDNGETIAEDDAEYVVVKVEETNNTNPALEDGKVDLFYWRLNRVQTYYEVPAAKGDTESTYIYRIRKGADKLVLKGDVTIFTSVSPIVGTEGAPRKVLTYSIALN